MSNFGRTATKNWLSLALVFLFTFSISLVGARFVRSFFTKNSTPPETTVDDSLANLTETPTSGFIETVELQPLIDSWALNLGDRVGVVVYDLDRSEISATYNAEKVFLTDNLRGLLLAYDGYRQFNTGAENPDTILVNATSYGSCLDDIIRMDDTICSEAILSSPERSKRIEGLISELGMTNTTDFGQSSTASDLAKLLPAIWEHRDLNLDNWAKLQDSMLDQPPTGNIDWRQGLPSGFSTAKVYNKASGLQSYSGGWLRYSNLAFVDFTKNGRQFAIVMLSENISDLTEFSRLGTIIEGKIIEE